MDAGNRGAGEGVNWKWRFMQNTRPSTSKPQEPDKASEPEDVR